MLAGVEAGAGAAVGDDVGGAAGAAAAGDAAARRAAGRSKAPTAPASASDWNSAALETLGDTSAGYMARRHPIHFVSEVSATRTPLITPQSPSCRPPKVLRKPSKSPPTALRTTSGRLQTTPLHDVCALLASGERRVLVLDGTELVGVLSQMHAARCVPTAAR